MIQVATLTESGKEVLFVMMRRNGQRFYLSVGKNMRGESYILYILLLDTIQ